MALGQKRVEHDEEVEIDAGKIIHPVHIAATKYEFPSEFRMP
jgi:hypothetical protein